MTDGKTVVFERVSAGTAFPSQLSSNNWSSHPAPPLQIMVAVRVNRLLTATGHPGAGQPSIPKLYSSNCPDYGSYYPQI